ncbi:MAG: hypothetical protein M3082_18765 [Candidatus Dormibacteraeota bacterium]|nr:hypothetical protein [Candidatus Dormibacteraeota bacterium]
MGTPLTRAERIAKAADLVAIGAKTKDPRRRRQLVEACARLVGPRGSR